MAQKAKNGDTVKVHYTGKLDDGTIFDSSVDREPLVFTLGEGNLIPGFESAVDGMEVGESKDVRIEATDAYGPWLEENIIEIPRKNIEDDVDIAVGQQVYLQRYDGATFIVTITGISETTVTLDANHPLAGKALNFNIKLVEIM